jgi:hypothetical protein
MTMMKRQPRQLPEILAEYRSAKDKADRNLDSVPESTRPGFGIAKRKAQEAIPNLKAEYLTRLLKNSVAAFAVGDDGKARQFATVAAKVGGTITVDARAPYEKMADRIAPSIGRSKQFSVDQASLLDQALKELAQDTGYLGKFENTSFRTLKVIPDRDSLVDYIRELVTASNGLTPAIIAAQNQILNESLKVGFDGKTLAVVVINAEPIDRQAIASMFTKTLEARVDEAEAIDERFARLIFEGSTRRGTTGQPPAGEANQNNNSQE